jgi:hypothetical protein
VAADLTSKAMPALEQAAATQAQLDNNAAQYNATQKNNAAAGFGQFLGNVAGTLIGL